MSIELERLRSLAELELEYGGELCGEMATANVARITRVVDANEGCLAPVLHRRYLMSGIAARARGAILLVSAEIAGDARMQVGCWAHPFASWVLAELLDQTRVRRTEAVIGEGSRIAKNVSLGPRVAIGKNVTIESGCVIGNPGFGWATRGHEVRSIPQLGGVIIEDDVFIGALSTIDAGTLSPTRIGRSVKIDAHCHVAHNCEIGERTIIAAQTGLAGSVVVGKNVLIGGQVGIADHVRIGDGARIAAKSGVIGDIPSGAVVAGYPAMPRMRWLRGLASLYKKRSE